jgi:hypothetical protein
MCCLGVTSSLSRTEVNVFFLFFYDVSLSIMRVYPSPIGGHRSSTAWVDCTISLVGNHCHFPRPCMKYIHKPSRSFSRLPVMSPFSQCPHVISLASLPRCWTSSNAGCQEGSSKHNPDWRKAPPIPFCYQSPSCRPPPSTLEKPSLKAQ